jgi:aromatic ring-opening dioxygenase catalytic subunit (LigB family)
MAQIVFAAGVPHAPAIVGLIDRAPPKARQVVRDTFAGLAAELERARPDVLIVFANDHLTNSRIRAYPDFLIGMGAEHRRPHEWFQPWIGCRSYAAPGDPAVAEALFRGMTRRGIRMHTQREPLKFDDNLSVPTVLLDLDRRPLRVVPVMQNCTVPPIPDQRRCYTVGQALGDFIRTEPPPDLRIGLIGSGGLSHEPGGARYFAVDEAFDRWFLGAMAEGDHEVLLRELTLERMEAVGSGGTAKCWRGWWCWALSASGAACPMATRHGGFRWQGPRSASGAACPMATRATWVSAAASARCAGTWTAPPRRPV